MRLLIILILGYLCYRFYKSWIKSQQKIDSDNVNDNQIDDIMVYDPFCRAYHPKKKAIRLKHNNEYLFFCSKECKEKFCEQIKESEGVKK